MPYYTGPAAKRSGLVSVWRCRHAWPSYHELLLGMEWAARCVWLVLGVRSDVSTNAKRDGTASQKIGPS